MYLARTITAGAVTIVLLGSLPVAKAQAVASPPGAAGLEVGEDVPIFESLDEFGRPWKSNKYVGRKILVMYFYPGDFTTGSTRQAHSFRDGLTALLAKGIKVVGISADSSATHQLFKDAHQINFTLLSDPEGTVAKLFGVPAGPGGKVRARTSAGEPLWDADGKTLVVSRPATLARWMLVLDREGKLAYKNNRMDPVKSAEDVLRVVESLEKKAP